jgi:SSS family solute:Na+ symporter
MSTLDLIIFFGSLLAVMGVGLWAGRKEETSDDYFLAGKETRWWGVAGSIFGSNVSANHIVGMMGVGFSVGLAQSHFEISAICGLLMLCYGFLPVYRKLNVYTLSEYLAQRYDDRSRIAYAIIMVAIMVVIQMVPGFYIGSRSLNVLLTEEPDRIQGTADGGSATTLIVQGLAENEDVRNRRIMLSREGENPVAAASVIVSSEGSILTVSGWGEVVPRAGDKYVIGSRLLERKWYIIGILLMAVVTGSYVIFGGLKAVITTDVIQSVLMLIAGITVAVITFSQEDVGGWSGMREMDKAGKDMVHLYLPSNHKDLPWTGVLSGLMILHFYYWGTNQFIVQRALSARTDKEARLGIIFAGFFKLLIPFFSIGTGIAAFYMFQKRGILLEQDVAFPMLMKHVVAPMGAGIVGLISAGLIGAILSSLDSMMNSAATIITFDIYKRYVDPDASEKKLISIGRICICIMVIGAAGLTILTMDPNSKDSFFLHVAKHQSKLIAGVVVAFGLGMIWKRATAAGGVCAIISGVVFSYGLPPIYTKMFGENQAVVDLFGKNLNFMHAVFLAAILSLIVHVVVSLMTQADEEKGKLSWTELGGHEPNALKQLFGKVIGALMVYAILAVCMVKGVISPTLAAWVAAFLTCALFWLRAFQVVKSENDGMVNASTFVREDRIWAGLLAGWAIHMMFYFY